MMPKVADANPGSAGAKTPGHVADERRNLDSDVPGGVEGRAGEPAGEAGGVASARILLVEDEPGIVDFVRRGFEADGFTVEAALDGVAGERLALEGIFDAIVLDLMLPGRDGLEVLASVRRAKPEVPVIVLTARGEIEDRVAGLDAGAVDYLVKPFSLAELLARVRAQLRVVAQTSATMLRGADIEVNLLTRKVRRGGTSVQLSSTEFELLVYLLRHFGQVLSREQILSAVWGYEHDPATNVVDVYIGYLRRKLARRDDPAPIYTVRAVGYRLGSIG
jgi:two-component system OmpR family response regulator